MSSLSSESNIRSSTSSIIIFSPIIEIPQPVSLRNWYRKRLRHEARVQEGVNSRPPAMPQQPDIFNNQSFLKFANLYLKVGYVLGGFQELNAINFELVREEMFGDKDEQNPNKDEHEDDVYEDEELDLSDDDAVDEEAEKKPNAFSRFCKWFVGLFHKR